MFRYLRIAVFERLRLSTEVTKGDNLLWRRFFQAMIGVVVALPPDSNVCCLRISERRDQADESTGTSVQAASADNPPAITNPGAGQPETTDGFRWGGAVRQSMFAGQA